MGVTPMVSWGGGGQTYLRAVAAVTGGCVCMTPIVYAGGGGGPNLPQGYSHSPPGNCVCVYVWGSVTSGLPHGPPEAHRYHTAASTVAPKPEFPHEFLRTPNYLRVAPRLPRDPKLPQGCPTDPSGSKNYLRFAPRIPRGPQLPQDCPHGSRG